MPGQVGPRSVPGALLVGIDRPSMMQRANLKPADVSHQRLSKGTRYAVPLGQGSPKSLRKGKPSPKASPACKAGEFIQGHASRCWPWRAGKQPPWHVLCQHGLCCSLVSWLPSRCSGITRLRLSAWNGEHAKASQSATLTVQANAAIKSCFRSAFGLPWNAKRTPQTPLSYADQSEPTNARELKLKLKGRLRLVSVADSDATEPEGLASLLGMPLKAE